MINEMAKKVLGTLTGAAIIAAFTWTYNSNTRITITEHRLQTVSEIATTNARIISEMQLQINSQNDEIIQLLSKQDNRLTKLETILELVVNPKE